LTTIELRVEGMSCGHCAHSVQSALKGIGARGKVDLNAKKVEIQYDPNRITLSAIKEAIEGKGYQVVD
jgi:copper chaperone